MAAGELSDAEVFGAPQRQLSDAEVFGSSGPAASEPKRNVPFGEYVSRKAAVGLDRTVAGVNLLAGGVPAFIDLASRLVTGGRDAGLADAYFKRMVTPVQNRANDIDIQPSETASMPARAVGMGFEMAPSLALPMGIGRAGPVSSVGRVMAAPTTRAAAVAPVIADVGMPAVGFAAPQAGQTAISTTDAGVPLPQAAAATAAKFGTGMVQGAAPIAAPGRLFGRGGVSAAGLGAGGGVMDSATQNAILSDRPDLQQDPMESAEMGGAMGAGMRLLLGGRAAVPSYRAGPTRDQLGYGSQTAPGAGQRASVSPAFMADFEANRPIMEANGITTPDDPRAGIILTTLANRAERQAAMRPGEGEFNGRGEQAPDVGLAKEAVASGDMHPKAAPWVGRQGDAPPPVIELPETSIAAQFARAARREGGVGEEFQKQAATAQGERNLGAGLNDEQVGMVSAFTGMRPEEVRSLSQPSQQRLFDTYQQQAETQGQGNRGTLKASFEGTPDALSSPPEKPNVPGDRTTTRGEYEDQNARVQPSDADIAAMEATPAAKQAAAKKSAMIEKLDAMRKQRESILTSEPYRQARARAKERVMSPAEKQVFDKVEKQQRALEASIFELEGKIYAAEPAADLGSKSASGTSNRPFRADDSSAGLGDHGALYEQRARDQASKAEKEAIDRMEADWRMREEIRREKEQQARAGERRQQETDQGGYGREYGEPGTKKAAPPESGIYTTDKDGFVRSDNGNPIHFGHQRDAGWWILKEGNKAGGGQRFEIANHPSGKGYSVRETGREPPPPPSQGDVVVRPNKDVPEEPPFAPGGDEPQPPPGPSNGPDAAPEPKPKPPKTRSLLREVKEWGGIKPDQALDIGGEKGFHANAGNRGLFKKNGLGIDEIATYMHERGWLSEGEYNDVDGGVQAARDKLRAALNRETVLHPHDEGAHMEYERDLRAYNDAGKEVGLADGEGADAALVQRATEIDGDAVERAAVQHGDDDAGFMRAIQEIIDNEQSAKINGGGEARESPRPEPEPNRAAAPEPAAADAGRPEFDLEQQTPEQLRRAAAERARSERDRVTKESAPPPSDFTLTGSDRPADEGAARGQNDLLGGTLNDFGGAVGKAVSDTFKWSTKAGREWIDNLIDNVKPLFPSTDSGVGKAAVDGAKAPAALVRFVLGSTEGRMRGLGANDIADKFFSPPGEGRALPETYEHGWKHQMNAALNAVERAMAPFDRGDALFTKYREQGMTRKDARDKAQAEVNATFDQIDSKQGVAAKQIATVLKDWAAYLNKLGALEDGQLVKDGYLPRMMDTEKVLASKANTKQFLADITEALRREGVDKPQAAAAAWLERMQTAGYGVDANGTDFVLGSATGAPSSLKGRSLSKAFENAMQARGWYVNDPVNSLTRYFNSTARKAEFLRVMDFGHPLDARGKEDTAKPKELRAWGKAKKDLTDGGRGDQIGDLVDLIKSATGMSGYSQAKTRSGANAVAAMRLLTTLSALERVVFSSLNDPVMGAVTAGRPQDIPKLAKLFAESVAKSGDMKSWERAAEDLGLITSAHLDTVLSSRLGIDMAEPATRTAITKGSENLGARFMYSVGMQQLQRNARIANTKYGAIMLRSLLRDHADDAKARFNLRDWGIPEGQIAAVAKWADKFDGMPTPEQMKKGGEQGALYRTALQRFVERSVIDVTKAEKAPWANTPAGQVIYALQSFNAGYAKNQLDRVQKAVPFIWKDKELTAAQKAAVIAGPAAGLVGVAILQAFAWEARDAIFGSGKEKTTGEKVMRGVSAGGLTGRADPFIQSVSGVRYGKDMASLGVGYAPGAILRALETGVRYADPENKAMALMDERAGRSLNSDKTNTAERALMGSIHDVILEPVLHGAIAASMPLRAGAALAAAPVQTMIGSQREKEAFVTETAGERKKKDKSAVY
jgi:hypothetical protein